MSAGAQNGTSADGVWRISIPGAVGAGNSFRRIPGLNKRFGTIYFRLVRHDGHLFLLTSAVVFALVATLAIQAIFQSPLAIFLLLALMVPAAIAGRYYFNDVRKIDPNKPFQLYLRSFVSDVKPIFPLSRHYRDTPLTGGMGRNIRAIGSPQDPFPRNLGFNVSLVTASDDTWQTVVIDMMQRASYIWIHCGLHHWVQWELQRALVLRDVTHIGFILPAENKEKVWQFVFSLAVQSSPEFGHLRELDVSKVMLICFTTGGTPVLVESQTNSPDDYLPGIYAARYALLVNASSSGQLSAIKHETQS
jgi:hypothetical protein